MADLLSDTPQRQQALADERGDEVAGSFDDLIRARAAEGWTRPPSARKGMTVVLQIGMLPDGTVTSVSVAKSSGDGFVRQFGGRGGQEYWPVDRDAGNETKRLRSLSFIQDDIHT